jgi:glycosyltransferase involved in cell wall biosynthesis
MENNLKILAAVYNYIAYDGRVQRAAESLSSLGDVSVLSIRNKREYHNPNFNSLSVPLSSMKVLKIFRHVKFFVVLCRYSLMLKPDIIHAHDYYLFASCWFASKLVGARLILDAHELIIPEEGEKKSLRSLFWYILERFTIKRANLVIAANDERAHLMQKHYKLTYKPTVVRNIPPHPKPLMENSEVFSRYPVLKYRTDKENIIFYQGDINLNRGINRFIEAIKFLPTTYRFLMFGDGPDRKQIEYMIESLNLGNRVKCNNRVPMNHLHDISRQCDIGVVTYPKAGLNNLYCSSNKIFEYAHAGLPVVTTDQPPLKKILDTYNIGLIVEDKDTSFVISKKIMEVVEHRSSYAKKLNNFLYDNKWEIEEIRFRIAVDSIFQRP